MNYFLWTAGKEDGPFSTEQLEEAMAGGTIKENHTARGENEREWKPLKQLLDAAKCSHSNYSPPTSKTPSSAKRVEAYLAQIRSASPYKLLRALIDSCVAIGGISCGALSVFNFANGQIGTGFLSLLCLMFLIAGRQSALVVVDIADTLLFEHSDRRS